MSQKRINISLADRLHAYKQLNLGDIEEGAELIASSLGAYNLATENIRLRPDQEGGIPLNEQFTYLAIWYVPYNRLTDIFGVVYKQENRIQTNLRWRYYSSPLLADPTGEDSWYAGRFQSEADIEEFRRFWTAFVQVHVHERDETVEPIKGCPACRKSEMEWEWING